MTETNKKDTNPKDAIGTWKWRQFSCIPLTVMAEVGMALVEGALKYGRHNYRESGVRSSVYMDAAWGHLMQYWEGEDLDPDTKLHHVTKAIASLVVLRDSMIEGKHIDDRPPKANLESIRENLQGVLDQLREKYPNPVAPYTETDLPFPEKQTQENRATFVSQRRQEETHKPPLPSGTDEKTKPQIEEGDQPAVDEPGVEKALCQYEVFLNKATSGDLVLPGRVTPSDLKKALQQANNVHGGRHRLDEMVKINMHWAFVKHTATRLARESDDVVCMLDKLRNGENSNV